MAARLHKIFRQNGGYILSVLLILSTIAVFGPVELYFANQSEFFFTLTDVLAVCGLLTAAGLILFTVLGAILPGRGRSLCGAVLFALGTALYIQGNFANIHYGTLDGKTIDWAAYPTYAVLDTLGWLLLLAAVIWLWARKNTLFRSIQRYGALFIMGIQAVTLCTLLLTGASSHKPAEHYMSSEGLYEVAEEENIIVFVLDSFDDAYWQALYQSDPDTYQAMFQDFTRFSNASAAAARTVAGLPAIITGENYPGQGTYPAYTAAAFNRDGLYTALNDQGYDVRIFCDQQFMPPDVGHLVHNQEAQGYQVTSHMALAEKLLRLTMYKHAPHVFKAPFWLYTGDFNQLRTARTDNVYRLDDAAFYADLALTSSGEKAFRLYHLFGAHTPYWLDENAQRTTEDTSLLRQTAGVMKIIGAYLDQLKQLGLYDSATIIVMADHGEYNPDYHIETNAHGLLLIKEKGAHGPLAANDAPVSYLDLHPTLFRALGMNKGDAFFDIAPDVQRVRPFLVYTIEDGKILTTEYAIDGHLDDPEACQPTGRVFVQDAY